jgi:hypothetical protein
MFSIVSLLPISDVGRAACVLKCCKKPDWPSCNRSVEARLAGQFGPADKAESRNGRSTMTQQTELDSTAEDYQLTIKPLPA